MMSFHHSLETLIPQRRETQSGLERENVEVGQSEESATDNQRTCIRPL